MDHKSDKKPESQSDKGPVSGRNSGKAYFPLDKKSSKSPVKKILAAGLLLMVLAGGGYWASQKTHTPSLESAVVVVSDKINLVNSISNLSDDYDPVADKIISHSPDQAPSMTLEQAHVNQKRAADAIEILKQEQKEIVESPEKNPDRAKLGLYKGILSKCYIGGHDVHWVDETGSILQHVDVETPLTGTASIARNMIYEMGGGLVVVIYEKGYEVYGSDGKLIKSGSDQEN